MRLGMHIEIVRKGWLRQKYHFVIIDNSNSNVLAHSENYFNYGDCYATAEKVAAGPIVIVSGRDGLYQ